VREVVGGSEFAGCGGVSGVFGADDEGEWEAEWDEAKGFGGWACGEGVGNVDGAAVKWTGSLASH